MGEYRPCGYCGASVDVRARDCIFCGRPARLSRPRVTPARRRSLLLGAGLLTLAGFLALYIYPNVRFARDEIAPRHRAPGIEFVELRGPADPAPATWAGAAPTESWTEWMLHGLRFRLPASTCLRFTGDERAGAVELRGWRIEYAYRAAHELPGGRKLPVESQDALDDLLASASNEWDFLADVYEARPDDFHIFYTAGARARLRVRLALKEVLALPGAESGISAIAAGGLDGFLFGRPDVDRRFGLQFPHGGGRLDLIVERLDSGSGRAAVLGWLASIGPVEGWLDSEVVARFRERLGSLRDLARRDRLASYSALFLVVGLGTCGTRDPEQLAELRRAVEEVRSIEERIESSLAEAAAAIGSEARRLGIERAAAGGEIDLDVLGGILERARHGHRPELGPLVAQALARIGSPRAVPDLGACLEASDTELARAAARALGRLVSSGQAPSPEADLTTWREWWEAHAGSISGGSGR